jgi:hypothetical protein
MAKKKQRESNSQNFWGEDDSPQNFILQSLFLKSIKYALNLSFPGIANCLVFSSLEAL